MYIDRAEACKRIKAGLRARTGRAWSVKGGRGTTWGWIYIQEPKSRTIDGGMSPADQDALRDIFFEGDGHPQGVMIPPSECERYVLAAEQANA